MSKGRNTNLFSGPAVDEGVKVTVRRVGTDVTVLPGRAVAVGVGDGPEVAVAVGVGVGVSGGGGT